MDYNSKILISHRGNIEGPKPNLENSPKYIENAIKLGYEVEIDVWIKENQLYLGHDNPQYHIQIDWLDSLKSKVWVHCKNLEALVYFTGSWRDFNFFFHENDLGVLTSLNYIWSTHIVDRGILVMPETFNTEPVPKTLGICSDYIKKYKK